MYMINLAGKENADDFIKEELYLAKIPLIKAEAHVQEIPYTITGRLDNWTFTRGWKYWRAKADETTGIPLDIAIELYEKEYPLKSPNLPGTLGDVIRVNGNSGSWHPDTCVTHYDSNNYELSVDPDGKKEKDLLKFLKRHNDIEPHNIRFVPHLVGYVEKSIISHYNIDDQIGLCEFAKVIKNLKLEEVTK